MAELTPECVALLKACRANPLDDTPRLVLADWYEEHDEADRAAFIRLQCELARPTLDETRLQKLRDQEGDLLRLHWRDWAGELPEIFREIDQDRRLYRLRMGLVEENDSPEYTRVEVNPFDPNNPWKFERGLLNLRLSLTSAMLPGILSWLESDIAQNLMQIRIDAMEFQQLPLLDIPPVLEPFLALEANLLLGEPPARRRVFYPVSRYTGTAEELSTSFKSKVFGLVRRFNFALNRNSPKHFQQILKADFSKVQELTLIGTKLTEHLAARMLGQSWNQLARLYLEGNDFDANFWTTAFQSGRFPNLVELVAYRNPMGNAGAKALAVSLGQTLTHVELMNCGIGDEGFIALLEAAMLERLRGPQLNFCMNPIGDASLQVLAEQPGLGRFTELVFRECQIGDGGATALANSPHAQQLTYLDLWKNKITDVGAVALAESPYLAHIQALNLRDNPLQAIGREALHDRFGHRVKT